MQISTEPAKLVSRELAGSPHLRTLGLRLQADVRGPRVLGPSLGIKRLRSS
jgi:hypothetical protein